MMTLRSFKKGLASVPVATAWSLTDLGQAIGRQELFTRQSPQRLKALREHALIESAVSSNRIEGVAVEAKRVGTLVFGKAALRDRDEEEVRGYRDALNLIHTRGTDLPVTQRTMKDLHRLARGSVGDAGQYKQKDTDIVEGFADGHERVRFRPTPARQTSAAMAEIVDLWTDCLKERWVPPLVAVAAFNLDFLCIHNYVLWILREAYKEFEQRVGQTAEPRGTKAAMVRDAVARLDGEFRLSDIERACPGVGREWIRTLLAEMKEAGEVTCKGRGPGARWRWLGNKGSTSK